MGIPVLGISGTIGVGKTTVSYEVRLRLRDASVSHVLIDDEFALFHPRPVMDPMGREVSTGALAALWSVYAAAGIERVVLRRSSRPQPIWIEFITRSPVRM